MMGTALLDVVADDTVGTGERVEHFVLLSTHPHNSYSVRGFFSFDIEPSFEVVIFGV